MIQDDLGKEANQLATKSMPLFVTKDRNEQRAQPDRQQVDPSISHQVPRHKYACRPKPGRDVDGDPEEPEPEIVRRRRDRTEHFDDSIDAIGC